LHAKCNAFTDFDLVILKIISQITQYNKDVLEEIVVTQLVKKYSVFHATKEFITIFTKAATGSYPEPDKSSRNFLSYFNQSSKH